MHKLLLGSTAVLALLAAGPAMAADMAVPHAPVYKAPPAPVAAVYGWSGCYVGVEGGGAWGRSHHDAVNPLLGATRIAGDYNVSGGLIGGTTGCNLQAGGAWVVGLEGDFSWVSKSGSANDSAPFNVNFVTGAKERWLGTGRARLGYLVAPQFLAYATGGFAAASVEADVTPPGLSTFTDTRTRWGWTVGGGGEYAFTNNLSVKLEYLFVQLQKTGYFDAPIVTSAGTIVPRSDVSMNDNIVRIGLNYRFTPAGPLER